MKQPIYLPIRDRLVLRHAANLLLAEAAVLRACNSIDGVIVDRKIKADYNDYRETAQALRRIARERVNPEPAP